MLAPMVPSPMNPTCIVSPQLGRGQMSDHECERRFQSSVGQVEPIEPRRGAAEQIRFLGRTCCPRQNLAGIPERRVAIGALVDREVALEHTAPGAESFDAGLEIRPPRMRQGFGSKRPWLLVKIK